jgi:hypothetical protein
VELAAPHNAACDAELAKRLTATSGSMEAARGATGAEDTAATLVGAAAVETDKLTAATPATILATLPL